MTHRERLDAWLAMRRKGQTWQMSVGIPPSPVEDALTESVEWALSEIDRLTQALDPERSMSVAWKVLATLDTLRIYTTLHRDDGDFEAVFAQESAGIADLFAAAIRARGEEPSDG